jgi:hypothetical protein
MKQQKKPHPLFIVPTIRRTNYPKEQKHKPIRSYIHSKRRGIHKPAKELGIYIGRVCISSIRSIKTWRIRKAQHIYFPVNPYMYLEMEEGESSISHG